LRGIKSKLEKIIAYFICVEFSNFKRLLARLNRLEEVLVLDVSNSFYCEEEKLKYSPFEVKLLFL